MTVHPVQLVLQAPLDHLANPVLTVLSGNLVLRAFKVNPVKAAHKDHPVRSVLLVLTVPRVPVVLLVKAANLEMPEKQVPMVLTDNQESQVNRVLKDTLDKRDSMDLRVVLEEQELRDTKAGWVHLETMGLRDKVEPRGRLGLVGTKVLLDFLVVVDLPDLLGPMERWVFKVIRVPLEFLVQLVVMGLKAHPVLSVTKAHLDLLVPLLSPTTCV